MTLEAVLSVLSHPLTMVAGSALLSLVLALWVGGLVKGLGLDELKVPALPQWRWSRFARAVVFLVVFLPMLAHSVGAGLGAGIALSELVVRLAAAGSCVAVGLWVTRAREQGAEDRGRDERQQVERQRDVVMGVAAGAALAALVGAAGTVVLLALAATALVTLLVVGGEPSRRLSLLLADLAAGVELRSRLRAGDGLDIDGVRHQLPLAPGLVHTRLDGAAGLQKLRNVELLERLAERIEQR